MQLFLHETEYSQCPTALFLLKFSAAHLDSQLCWLGPQFLLSAVTCKNLVNWSVKQQGNVSNLPGA